MPHVTLSDFYDALKYWGPILGAFGLLIKAYKGAKTGVTEWADRLLNNHLAHIQENTRVTAEQMKAFREEGSRPVQVVAEKLEEIAEDLREHEKDDKDVQGKILAKLEVIEAKQD